MTTNQNKAALESTLSKVCGVNVEITIRSKGFTISADGKSESALEKAKSFFAGAVKNWITEYDEECDFTCAYFNLQA